MDYADDVDDNVFLFKRYGKAICHPATPFVNSRTDIHLWNREQDLPEFEKNFVIAPDVDPAVRAQIFSIIETH